MIILFIHLEYIQIDLLLSAAARLGHDAVLFFFLEFFNLTYCLSFFSFLFISKHLSLVELD